MIRRPWFLTLPALAAGLFLFGCGKYFYKPKPLILPPYIQKIAIRPFSNHTQQYGLEDKLTLATQSEFSHDGRYQITTEDQGDGVVIGDITRYTLEPLSYDVNHVPTEYKLWILVDLSFYDKVKGQTLWKEPNMEGELRFFAPSSGLSGSMSEVDAQQSIWDQLSRDIVTRTLEGFGSATGSSEKYDLKAASSTYNSHPTGNDGPPPMPSQQPTAPAQQPY